MKYFKFLGNITNEDWLETYNNRDAFEGVACDITRAVEEFDRSHIGLCYVTRIQGEKIEIGAILEYSENEMEYVYEFLEKTELEVEIFSVKEIGMYSTKRLITESERHDFLDDECYYLDKYDLDFLGPKFAPMPFIERIVNDVDSEIIDKESKDCMCDETLLPEIDRIRKEAKKVHGIAHPVHYVVRSTEWELSEKLTELLVTELYKNFRVKSGRYSIAKVDGTKHSIRYSECKKLYQNSVGGTVVLDVRVPDTEESDQVSGELEMVEDVCEIVKRYRNQVLTIMCFPYNSKRIKNLFFEHLHNISLVEIEEDLSNKDKSIEYLKKRAKENHIRYDKNLFNQIEEGQEFFTKELNEIFDEWFHLKVKNTYYPQYKECKTIKKDENEKRAKGIAYEDLSEMIGLTESKKIINKAIDFYTAQKMFADKGMKAKSPAMHMVFTGNPGSAKTTVARLFARILRDNKVLSRGHMIEVGRGDLVGMFVGWTAPIVKRKFAEAKGGVLFIDEAYSLVDDRSGSFGDEAINTIVQEMENHRDDVVVIFAGYPKEMKKFLDKNPGLKSRIAFHVPFDDYNPDELCEIAKLMAKNDEMVLSDDALDKMHDIFETVCKCEDFGNGRFVRNILEDARMTQASRLVEMGYDKVKKSDIKTLKACDIEMPDNYKVKKEESSIGFVS